MLMAIECECDIGLDVEGAVLEGAMFSLDGLGGAILPGDWPGCVTCAAFGAPVGAGLDVADEDIGAGDAMPPLDEDGAGAILPGDWPGLVTCAAFGAPVGAGEAVCAQAMPAEIITAAEASKSERMEFSPKLELLGA